MKCLPLHLTQHAIYYLHRLDESACEKMKGRCTVSEDDSKAATKLMFREGEGVFMTPQLSSVIRREHILMPLSGFLCYEEVMDSGLDASDK